MENFIIRSHKKEDIPLVFNSFTGCMRASISYRGCVDRIFYRNISKLFKGWFNVSDVLIIHPEGQPDVVAGWIVYCDTTIVFSYVKFSYRKRGLFTALLKAAGVNKSGVQYIFSTFAATLHAEKYGWSFNPFRQSTPPEGWQFRLIWDKRLSVAMWSHSN